MEELIGAVVGNYQIESLIEEGGMGRVYRARHLHLNRLAAIKIMLPELESIPGYRARFLQEARAAAGLRHPNIIEVHDFGEHRGHCFLVMDLVPDGNLLNLMHGKRAAEPLSLALGLDLVRQAAIGLDYAHRRGMVHRDVKPANLLLEASADDLHAYTLKVSDFGLARLREGGIETTIGKVRGTLAYMSPEQCQGLDLDGRSDLYSLGIILFELATGRRPFEIKSPADALYKHIYAQPATPRSVRPELPAELESIILRCLEKDPSKRFSSCAELASNLQSLVKRGVLVGDATQVDGQPEVSTSLHALALGVLSEPPEVDEGGDLRVVAKRPEVVRSETARAGMPCVRAFDASGQTLRLLELTGDGLTVGGLADNDLALETEGISRHHLRIDWDGSAASVTDLGSRNGTFTQSGQRLIAGQKHPWKPTEPLQVGECWLRLETMDQAGATREAPAGTITRIPGLIPPVAELTRKVASGAALGEAAAGEERTTIPPAQPAMDDGAGLEQAAEPEVVGPIGLSIEPVQLRLTLSKPASLIVKLHNQGSAPLRLGVLVEGVPDAWVRRSGLPALIAPGDKSSLELTILVPELPTSRAGDYPIVIRATNSTRKALGGGGEQPATLDGAAEPTVGEEWLPLPYTASGRWTVYPMAKPSLTLLPGRLAALRIAEYQVKLENEGNSASTFELSVAEPVAAEMGGDGEASGGDGGPVSRQVGQAAAPALAYEFSQQRISLEPGEAAEVKLRVRTPARWVGGETVLPFEVKAKVDEVSLPLTAKAELVRRALLPLWAALAASLIFGLSAVGVLAFSLGGAQPPIPTATPAVVLQPTPTAELALVVTETPSSGSRRADRHGDGGASNGDPRAQLADSRGRARRHSDAPVAPTPTLMVLLTPTPIPTPTHTPCSAPSIASFAPNQPEIVTSQSSTLSWNVTGAEQVSIDHGIGGVGAKGTKAVSPTANTTYTLTAKSCGGQVTKKATVAVVPPPVVVAFTALPPTIVRGKSTTVNWKVTGADQVSIDNGIGAVAATDAKPVSPTVTTTYTITASKHGYTVTKKLSLTVYSHATVGVAFTQVIIHNDADPSAAGEVWLNFRVNDQLGRWPNSGTRSVNSGGTYAVDDSSPWTFCHRWAVDHCIRNRGRHTTLRPHDGMGPSSSSTTALTEWGKGTHADRGTCPDGCYTIGYTVSVTWLE